MRPATIIAIAARQFGTTPEMIRNRSRVRHAVDARRCAALLLARHGVSVRETASEMGKPVQSVYWAIQSAHALVLTDASFARAVNAAEECLLQHREGA